MEEISITISFQFPLASRLALPDSESVFGISQGPPMCTHMSQPRSIILPKRHNVQAVRSIEEGL